MDLWTDPAGVEALLATWREKLVSTVGVGRQQQQYIMVITNCQLPVCVTSFKHHFDFEMHLLCNVFAFLYMYNAIKINFCATSFKLIDMQFPLIVDLLAVI